MEQAVQLEIETLRDASVAQLQQRYREVYGEEPRSRNRQFLWRRVAWRLQALAEGDLTERARRRAMELANDADLRTRAPRGFSQTYSAPPGALTVTGQLSHKLDPRLPMPGTLLRREYRGRHISVLVLNDGFEWEGKVYKTLSAIAKVATGTQWNGYDFFGLKKGSN